MAAWLSARLRLPMLRMAQLTAFLTKLRGSVAPALMTGKSAMNCASEASLSCQALQAMSA